MNRIIVGVFAAFLSQMALAGPIGFSKAKSLAESFFNSDEAVGTSSRSKTGVARYEELYLLDTPTATRSFGDELHPEYYVFAPADSIGFVIVAGDDEVSPIVGYSLETRYCHHDTPVALKRFLDAYQQYICDVREGKIEAIKHVSQDVTPVAPLISTTWNQGYPYNNLCPRIDGKLSLVGCTSVSLAQIMKYYEWPDCGTGTCSATLSDAEQTTVTTTLETYYDWASMRKSYVSGYTPKQRTAVTTLLRDVGYACSTIYGLDVTWTYNVDALKAMLRHFKYSPDIKFVDRRYYSDDTWRSMMSNELVNGRPIWICGQDENGTGGHSFVCCGIDKSGRYYINWGWGGNADGYFDLNAFSPYSYAYNNEQQALMNIKPIEEGENAEDFSLIPHVGDVNLLYQINQGSPVVEFLIYTTNTSDRTISGKIGYALYRDGAMLTSGITELVYHPELLGNWWYESMSHVSTPELLGLPQGYSEIKFYWQPDGSNEWYEPLGDSHVIYVTSNESGHYFTKERPEDMPNSISVVSQDVSICNEEGGISLVASDARQIDVYSLNGMLVRSVKLSAGEKVNLQLPNGVYVVGNRRIVVQ